MKKSSFTAMFMGTINGLFFALGMCMALIPEWNALREGVIFGGIGIAAADIDACFFSGAKQSRKPKYDNDIRSGSLFHYI